MITAPVLLFLVPAASAEKWPVADIVATASVAATPAEMLTVLVDLPRVGPLLPRECVGTWTPGTPSVGKGATAVVRYDMAAMHRKLAMTVTRADDEGQRVIVDWDHAGNRGFVTRWVAEASEGGSKVTLTTPINPPPWPFTAYYYQAVKPEWDRCQASFIAAVAAGAASGR